MTSEAARLRTVWQVGLLTAGFLVLVAISAASLYLGHRARTDALWVTHTVEVESQIGTVLDVRDRVFRQNPPHNITALGVNWLAGFDFEIKVIARIPS